MIGRRELWRIWWVRHFVAQLIQPLQGWLYDICLNVTVEWTWSFSIGQFRQTISKVLVSFVNLITILLCCYSFAWVQESVMNRTSQRLLNSHHIFLMQFYLREVLWSLIAVRTLNQPLVVQNPFFIMRYKPVNKGKYAIWKWRISRFSSIGAEPTCQASFSFQF